jgi:branched-chain amino acid aminotransferase
VAGDRDEWTVGDGSPGPVSMQLREHLIGIQTGQEIDKHNWMHRLV